MEAQDIEYQYQPEHRLSWGNYKCQLCNSEFSDINEPLHKNGCKPLKITYFFGPREAKRVLLFGTSMHSSLRKEHLDKLLDKEQIKFLLETSDNRLFSQ